MAYATLTTAAGQILTSAMWNQARDNDEYLKDRVDNAPYAAVYHNATQSIGNNADTVVAFNSEFGDTGGLHDNATNNGRLTLPAGGNWLFTAHVEFAANATGQRRLYLRFGGATDVGGVAFDAGAALVTKLSTAILLTGLSAGNYLEVIVFQNSGGALNLSANPRFSAQRVL